MLEWKRRFALAALVGLLALVGCGQGGGSAPTFSILGTIAGATSVTVSLTGTATASTTTDVRGGYWFSSLANGGYTVTPSKDGYAFGPASVYLTVNSGDVTHQDFAAGVLSGWHKQNLLPLGNGLFGVWGSGSSDVWAVGLGGTILHWNGSAWARLMSVTSSDLYGVWGSGTSDVWAVGYPGTVVERRL